MTSTSRDRISELPHEVLDIIIGKIRLSKTLRDLCLVSRLFNTVASPFLYERLIFSCPEGGEEYYPCEEDTTRTKLLQNIAKTCSLIKTGYNVQYVRDLEFRTKLGNGYEACWHKGPNKKYTSIGEGQIKSGKQGSKRFFDNHILALCQSLPTNNLHSFSWHLESCVPLSLLGPNGYLPKFQPSIRKLSLINSLLCGKHFSSDIQYDLSRFNTLRSFSWVGPRIKDHYIALRDCLTLNASHLETLSLDLAEWKDALIRGFDDDPTYDYTRKPWNFFTQGVLLIARDQDINKNTARFPMLKCLALSQAPFGDSDSVLERTSTALAFSQLKELKLWNCDGMLSMLDLLAKNDTCSQLIRLEISIFDPVGIVMWKKFGLVPFLNSLSSLEDVFLMIDTIDWYAITRSICSHIPSLKRMVFHDRCCMSKSFYGTGERVDIISIEDEQAPYNDDMRKLLTQTDSEFMGLSYDLNGLRGKLQRDALEVSCKILHVRSSANMEFCGMCEVDRFATWIFGPKGMKNLRVLAYGDFTFQKDGKQILYCRNEEAGIGQSPFRELVSRDADLWSLVEENYYALKACPYKSLSYMQEDIDEAD